MKLVSKPAFYFPLTNDRYEVRAGFSRLDKDFGNGLVDQQTFQFDNMFQHYRDNKLACRHERLAKYYQEQFISRELAQDLNAFLIERLCVEHPEKFSKTRQNSYTKLACSLTGETLVFDDDMQLKNAINTKTKVPYVSSLDAIANQIQEDLAIVQLNETSESICALHLCSPNHWAAEDKIGQSFFAAHHPVPHMEKINQQSYNLFRAVLEKGPYVRFAWGLATDTQLNHHPQPPPSIDFEQWQGRQFNPSKPELWLRVERQTLTGFQQVNAILFTIRTYFYDIKQLVGDEQNLSRIVAALQSMSDASLSYKGLQQSKGAILNWLDSMRQN